MEADATFVCLLERVRQGDQAASSDLTRLYGPEVRRFVHYRLSSPKMRRFLDSLDICQSVFGKFFVRILDGQYDLQNSKQLVQLLMTMANNRLMDHFRKQAAVRRGGPEVPAGETIDLVADSGPNAAELAESRDLVDVFRARLSSEEMQILDRRMDGDDWPAIAAGAGASSEAVRKRFTRAVDRVAKELGWEDTP